jgi:hypothetical protein
MLGVVNTDPRRFRRRDIEVVVWKRGWGGEICVFGIAEEARGFLVRCDSAPSQLLSLLCLDCFRVSPLIVVGTAIRVADESGN